MIELDQDDPVIKELRAHFSQELSIDDLELGLAALCRQDLGFYTDGRLKVNDRAQLLDTYAPRVGADDDELLAQRDRGYLYRLRLVNIAWIDALVSRGWRVIEEDQPKGWDWRGRRDIRLADENMPPPERICRVCPELLRCTAAGRFT